MIVKNGMRLVDTFGKDVNVGDELTDFRGDKATVTGGEPPRHAASSGRIWVKEPGSDSTREYFPTVFGCKWVDA